MACAGVRDYVFAMKTPTSEEISVRAYALWEQRGRPQDYQSSVDCWLAAERELAEAGDDAASLDLRGGAKITNMDLALAPAERSRARSERREKNGTAEAPRESRSAEHFIVAADRAHLRIYQEAPSETDSGDGLRIASAFDLPSGKSHYTDRDSDQAGRFPGPRGKGTALGGSIDERLPMLEEQQRRAAGELGRHMNEFLRQHPDATWDFAAGPVVHRGILEVLDPDVRSRLGEALVKELVKQPLPELRGHFGQNPQAQEVH
jgi:Protein required for attachment to host cells/Protein of unknown function (DUF2934)